MSVDECTCFFHAGLSKSKGSGFGSGSHTSFLYGVYNTTDRRTWLRFGDIIMKLIRDAEVVLREKDYKKR